MIDLLEDGIHIARRGDYNDVFITQWTGLFRRCFGGSEKNSLRVFQKYILNESRICYLIKNEIMVAAYCGLLLNHEVGTIFLSTDTMSDGTQKGSSVVLGKRLYKSLPEDDVFVVCGYPNENIRKIRERGLGWALDGGLDLYLGIPFLWRFGRNQEEKNPLWRVIRPTDGWFTREKPFFVSLLGRDRLYSSGFGVVITLSAYRPGAFFIRLPNFLFEPRRFGYKFIAEDDVRKGGFLTSVKFLDVDTIDIP